MEILDAVIKSMKVYWKKEKEFEALSTSKDRKYTKKYFDGVEKELLSAKDAKETKEYTKEKSKDAKPSVKRTYPR